MKTSTEIASAARIIGEEKAIELYAKAGFDAYDFSMFSMARWDYENKRLFDIPHPLNSNEYLQFARKLKRIADDCGIKCNQSHAPFPSNLIPHDFLKRAIECTAEAGGEICVIHPYNLGTTEENAEFYHSLIPFAKEYGIKIATENMWCWDREKDESSFAACATGKNFCEVVDAVNSEYLVACLDIGHAEMRGSGDGVVNMIHALGKRLKALHIHDNDRWHDSHQIPFSMNIDFAAVVKALKDVEYSGYLTLEADRYLTSYTEENIYDGIVKLYESVKKLDAMM